MPRDRMTRMDIDTDLFNHRRMRRLQTAEPRRWPVYAVAWENLLAETWASGSRLTLDECWLPVVPCKPDEARKALASAGLIDEESRIRQDSWDDWIWPAIERMRKQSEGGRRGNRLRWGTGSGGESPTESVSDHPPNPQPAKPANQPSQPTIEPPTDAFDAYVLATGRSPKNGALDWLNRLSKDHGEGLVARTIVKEWEREPKIGTLLGRVEQRIALVVHRRDREQVQNDAKQAARLREEDQRRRQEATPEEAEQADLQRKAIRIGLGGGGTVPTDPVEVRAYVEAWEVEHGPVP